MNKTILLLFSLIAFTACDDDIDYPYSGKDRIQFLSYWTDWNGLRTYSDSLVCSFGLRPDSIRIDTARVIVEYLGRGSDRDRTYRVLTVADSSNAVAGEHYDAIDPVRTFKAGASKDTILILVHRDKLSTSFINPEKLRLDLKLEATEDFDLGLKDGLYKKITFYNFLTEPDWWEGNFGGTLGYYHPEKWKILISFNERFATYVDCPFDTNNEGRAYTNQLSNYLDHVPTFDDETGERLYMYYKEKEEK